jgi:hypothetical protein
MCYFGKIGSYLSLAVWYFQGLLTPVIAGIAIYIAWQQWKTNRQKLKLDLYDRRLKVFERVREILAMMYTTVSDDKRLFELLSGTRDAEFLFGVEIKDYIEEVYRRASTLSATNKQLRAILETAPAELRKKLADVESEQVKWAFEQTRVVADKFKQYINLSKL